MIKEEFNKGLNYCFLLLKYRIRSKNEIIFRLKRKGYPLSLAKEIADYLEKNNYINDRDFVFSFVASCQDKGWGERKIAFSLKKFAVDKDLVKNALSKKEVFREKIRELIERKKNYYKDPNKYQKIFRFLVSRGFSYDAIYSEIEKSGLKR